MTMLLGVLDRFIDDYFNWPDRGCCMRPAHREPSHLLRPGLVIDATAAPVCMIAPVSSWAAAVSGCI